VKSIIIDNYDSFTFNLYQLVAQVNGTEPIVIRNDQMSWQELSRLDFDNIILSPGPGAPDHPSDVGICPEIVRDARRPVLGVCLGHQILGHAFGGSVIRAPVPMHGRICEVSHRDSSLFSKIPGRFAAVRYHSLIVALPLPEILEPLAWTADGILMAMRHRNRPLWGVQFHPESIATEYGFQLLANFADLTRAYRSALEPDGRAGQVSRGLSVVPQREAVKPEPTPRYEVQWRKLPWSTEPEAAFARIFEPRPGAFWLDSSLVVEGLSRFSYMGAADGPHAQMLCYSVAARRISVSRGGNVETHAGDLLEFMRKELQQAFVATPGLPFDFAGGFVGYFGYELKGSHGGEAVHRSVHDDAHFVFADRIVVFDHQEHAIYLVALVQRGQAQDASEWFASTRAELEAAVPLAPPHNGPMHVPLDPAKYLARDRETYLSDIEACLQEIRAGETYEVCLTNKMRVATHVQPFRFYRLLRRLNAAPYAAFLKVRGATIACSSPERFLRVDRSRMVESKPIKGTAPRGQTPQDDLRYRDALRSGEKEASENLMIVDLVRNDLGLVCEVGSVHVPNLMAVESYATVHQLVSTIRGTLRSDMDALDAIRAAFPGGSMTGAPKLRTMQIIDRLEGEARGVYSGAVGFLSVNGSTDLCIVIRTAVFTSGHVSIGTGGAIVALSDAEAEYEEILLKARVLLDTLAKSTPDRPAGALDTARALCAEEGLAQERERYGS
jgi:para-aminobenzoate synthetase